MFQHLNLCQKFAVFNILRYTEYLLLCLFPCSCNGKWQYIAKLLPILAPQLQNYGQSFIHLHLLVGLALNSLYINWTEQINYLTHNFTDLFLRDRSLLSWVVERKERNKYSNGWLGHGSTMSSNYLKNSEKDFWRYSFMFDQIALSWHVINLLLQDRYLFVSCLSWNLRLFINYQLCRRFLTCFGFITLPKSWQ